MGASVGAGTPRRAPSIAVLQLFWCVVAGVVVAGLVWVTLRVVDESPGFSYVGSSNVTRWAVAGVVTLLTGVGITYRLARPANRFGWLLMLVAGLLLVAEWDIPGATATGPLSAVVFSAGLVCGAALPAATTWAVLAFPSGRVVGSLERAVLVAGGVILVGGLGVVPALFFDPQSQGCPDCPTNLLLVHDDPDLATALSRIGMTAALAWATTVVGMLLVTFARMSPAARRTRGAVWSIGVLYLVIVSAELVLALDQGFVGGSSTDPWLWWAAIGALAALAVAVVFSLLRARTMRRRVAGLVVDLHLGAAPGGMREALADWLRDPSLQVAYPVDGYRGVDLVPLDVTNVPGRVVTRLMDGIGEIAVLVHRPGLLDNPDAVRDVVTAARLGLENERLRAEGLAQLRALADSRVRIIEAGDRERRRLERDLHDGAQQRLVGLLLGLRLLRSTLPGDHPEVAQALGQAETEIQGTVGDLRELATGLFPNILAIEGLASAWQALSETAPLRVVDALEGRLPAVAETTAYLVVAKAVARGPTTVEAAYASGRLRVRAEVAGGRVDLGGLEDRVVSLGGQVRVEPVVDGCRVDLDLPIASPVADPTGAAVGDGANW
ncbi:hypothetical protein GCM10027053_25450 [Intrasporangium mesophilum]